VCPVMPTMEQQVQREASRYLPELPRVADLENLGLEGLEAPKADLILV
jgi:hypothetical protein